MSREMIGCILCGVVATICLGARWPLAAMLFFGVMYIFAFRQRQDDKRRRMGKNKEIIDSDQRLKSGITETHMRLHELTHIQESLKQSVIELLVEAACHLGAPPTSRRPVSVDDLIAWTMREPSFLLWRRHALQASSPHIHGSKEHLPKIEITRNLNSPTTTLRRV